MSFTCLKSMFTREPLRFNVFLPPAGCFVEGSEVLGNPSVARTSDLAEGFRVDR